MSLSKNKTNKLLLRFKNGDSAAFKELFDFLYKRLIVVAGSILLDKSQAEDVVSYTFLQICKNIDSFDEGKDGYNWIYKIAKNKALDINREYQANCELDESYAVGDIFDSQNNKADLYTALRKLEKTEQKLIYMRFFEEKTYSEIGEELSISQQMVHKKIQEILKKLKKLYENG